MGEEGQMKIYPYKKCGGGGRKSFSNAEGEGVQNVLR